MSANLGDCEVSEIPTTRYAQRKDSQYYRSHVPFFFGRVYVVRTLYTVNACIVVRANAAPRLDPGYRVAPQEEQDFERVAVENRDDGTAEVLSHRV